MSSKKEPRLKFNRETFRKLAAGQLAAVAGGMFRTSGGDYCGPDAGCSSKDGSPPTQCNTVDCSLHCYDY